MAAEKQQEWRFEKWDAVLGPKFYSPDGQRWSMGGQRNSNTSGYALADYLNRIESDKATAVKALRAIAELCGDVADLHVTAAFVDDVESIAQAALDALGSEV